MKSEGVCYQAEMTPWAQLSFADQRHKVSQLEKFVTHLDDFRLWVWHQPQSLARNWLDKRATKAEQAAELWQKTGYEEEIWLGRQLAQQVRLKQISSFLWSPKTEEVWGDGSDWGLDLQPRKVPTFLQGDYQAYVNELRPYHPKKEAEPSGTPPPYALVVTSYLFANQWDWYEPLGRILLESEGDMCICIDGTAVSTNKLARMATHWSNQAKVASHQTGLTGFALRETAVSGQHLLEAVQSGMVLHNIQISFLLLDPDLQRLHQRKKRLTARLKGYIELDWLRGYQQEAIRFFLPVKRPLSLPQTAHNMLSSGTARLLGLIGYGKKSTYEGIFLGIGRGLMRHQVTDLSYLDLWKKRQASHLLVLGETGFGKTVFAHSLIARQVEAGQQAILLEPQGHSGRHLHPYFPADVSLHNRLRIDQLQLNPLDIVAPTFIEQCDYFIGLLESLLNPHGDRRRQRMLHNREIGAVQEALYRFYQGQSWQESYKSRAELPLLQDFCTLLRQIKGGEQVASELHHLYVAGPWGGVFNRPSNLNIHLNRPDSSLWPVVSFDLHGVGQRWRSLFYFIILSAIQRAIRQSHDPADQASRRPRRLVVLDEVRYLTQQVGGLSEWLANQIATARTFNTAFVLIDQNPITFLGEGENRTARIHMLENMAYLLSFRLRPTGVARLQQLYPQIAPSHMAYLQQADVGDALLLERQRRTRLVHIALRPSEQKHFLGS